MIRVYAKLDARFYVVWTGVGYTADDFVVDGQGDHVDVRNDSHKVTWFKTKRLATYHPAFVAHCEQVKREKLSQQLELMKSAQTYAGKEADALRFRSLHPTGEPESINPSDYPNMALDVEIRGWAWGFAADEILRAASEARETERQRLIQKQEIDNG